MKNGLGNHVILITTIKVHLVQFCFEFLQELLTVWKLYLTQKSVSRDFQTL